MSSSYTMLPAFYDFFGKHPDYKGYANAVLTKYQEIGAKESNLILDLACGTGRLTLELLKKGADVIGTDLSAEMLMIARERCADKGFFPLLLGQDMRELDLYGTVDVAVSATNSLNYLPSEGDLKKVFALVHNFLTPNGLFFFDINSLYKFEHLYGENVYTFESENGFCVWQNHYLKSKKRADFLLTIFKKEKDGRYTRLEEEQSQYYYSNRTVKRLLKETGFEFLSLSADFKGTECRKQDSDCFYLARCKKQEGSIL